MQEKSNIVIKTSKFSKMEKVVTFGELMLRLTPPAREMILQTPNMVCTFGGAEANVAVAVSAYGDDAKFVTALPKNDIGRAAVSELRRFGIDTSAIKMTGKRLGLYFTETGSNMRPSKVIYDRDNTAISAVKPGEFNWDEILDGGFHQSRKYSITYIVDRIGGDSFAYFDSATIADLMK